MFEILTQEQVKEMSDRELGLSEYYFRHNLTEITNERFQRSLLTAHEPVAENSTDRLTVIGRGKMSERMIFSGDIGQSSSENKINKRGRKKKVK